MSLAVLRASGATFDAPSFARTLALDCDAVWRAGEHRPGGAPHAESGFNLTVAEAERPFDVADRAAAWLHDHRDLLEALRNAGATACLDFALFCDPERPAQSVRFEPTFTALCADLGVTLEVSAYASAG